ncbi:FtsH protease activity modulator HflK [Candidatus Liberibacter sp.]|uniref:FtsH protease activity modulator HflK n=1 Tax=Candidatus Liberibacter sp. TaxID=34022 RepID=UPI0015F61842|nr:FtsH protease activity modulator HflK [Candidatus Liberibacter sp.]MBA5724030.1 FtsH protease activity modulator HflK [Candidatus Liberibacter sp.]
MPWSNQSGGGPWGTRQSNSPEGGSSPPDFTKLVDGMRDKMHSLPPLGTCGIFFIFCLFGFFLCLFQSVYIVHSDERAVELHFGKPKEEIFLPGLHMMFWPIEKVEIVKVTERQMNIGSQVSDNSSSGLMLTGDQNIVSVQFSILYTVSDPQLYLFSLERSGETLRQVAESAMREVVGRRSAVDIFRSQRQQIALDVRSVIQKAMDSYKSGIVINTVSIEDASPPREVADAFDEVQRAEQDEDRFVEESNKYSNRVLGSARGNASRIREASIAYKDRVVQEARGEADRFLSVYGQYVHAPDLVRKRLYVEAMEDILKKSKKIIIDKDQSTVPYLPLNEVFSSKRKEEKSGDGNAVE